MGEGGGTVAFDGGMADPSKAIAGDGRHEEKAPLGGDEPRQQENEPQRASQIVERAR